MTSMQDGIHYGVPFSEYQDWNAINQSTLKEGCRSMAHLLNAYIAKPVESKSFALGHAFHAAVLEPDRFDTEYVLEPEPGTYPPVADEWNAYREKNSDKGDDWCATNFKRTNAWKTAMSAFGISNVGKAKITLQDLQTVKQMKAALFANRTWQKISEDAEHTESSMLWHDTKNVLCKARLDMISPAGLIDLKTTEDASPKAFMRSIANYGYHFQAAFYQRGFNKITGKEVPVYFVVVEKTMPFGVAVYAMPWSAIMAGNEVIETLLAEYADCLASDTWPGYLDAVQELDLPHWVVAA
ncbi:MAG: PD-(D/E)XK nuclease-like domain-containing protein [Verrucomicrobiota bacterium]